MPQSGVLLQIISAETPTASPSGQDSVRARHVAVDRRLRCPSVISPTSGDGESDQIRADPPLTRNFAPPTENRAVQKPHAATTRGYGRSRRHNWVWKSAGCRDSTPLGPRRTRCRTRRRIRRKNDSLGSEAVRCSKMFHADEAPTSVPGAGGDERCRRRRRCRVSVARKRDALPRCLREAYLAGTRCPDVRAGRGTKATTDAQAAEPSQRRRLTARGGTIGSAHCLRR